MLIVSPTLFFIFFSYLFTLSFPPKSQSKSNDIDHKHLAQGARLGVWSEPVLKVLLSLPVTPCGSSLPPPAHSQATKASVWAVRHLPGPQESLSAPTESMEVEVGKDLKGQLRCQSFLLLLCTISGTFWWLLSRYQALPFRDHLADL